METKICPERQACELVDEEELLISVRNVSKKFCKNLKRSMLYGLGELTKNLLGIKPETDCLRKDEFWALDDVSFEVKKGEILGIIGPNGSGKTTLLRLVTGIFPPDKGIIQVKGRIGALIALGAGFHPHMTGKENIYLNGAILGMSRREIDKRIDEIVSFSELGDFIDAPVSTYSSGMKVRLGFSIAAHIEPDILLVDEVLSVGDASFRQRSSSRFVDFKSKGGTVLLVSHNMVVIEMLCDRVMWVENGCIAEMGEPSQVIRAYEEWSMIKSRKTRLLLDQTIGEPSYKICITDVRFFDVDGNPKEEFQYKESFTIHLQYEMEEQLPLPSFEIGLSREGLGEKPGANLASFTTFISMFWDGIRIENLASKGEVKCIIEDPHITPGNYGVHVGVLNSIGAVPLGRVWYEPYRKRSAITILPGALDKELPGAPMRDLAEVMPQLLVKHDWHLNGEDLSPGARAVK